MPKWERRATTGTDDAADAEAICEAVGRPNMRFVPIKNIEQQAALSLHRVRQGFIRERTALANRIRGLLAEFGLIIPQGIHHIARRMPEILEDADNELSDPMRALLARLLEHLQELNRQAQELEAQIIAWHRNNELSRKLEAVPGIGPLTASALVATVGDAKNFKNGRQMAAWLGLVPKQESSGGKTVLLGISKRGDVYLRTLLIHGARAVLWAAQRRKATVDRWVQGLLERRNANVAAVAMANKTARIVWALLAKARQYDPQHVSTSAAA